MNSVASPEDLHKVFDQALSPLAPLDFDVWLRFGSQTSYAFQ